MSSVNTNLPSEVISKLINLTGDVAQEIAVGKVEKINADKTINVSIITGINTNKIFNGVRILSPYKNGESGVVIIPEVGALVLVVIVNSAYQFIVGYLNYHDNISDLINNAKEGEFIFKTPFGSYIKMNEDNSIDIHTGENSSLFLDKELFVKASESTYEVDVASEKFSGVKGDIVYTSEKCYDKDVKSPQTNKDIVEGLGDLLYPYVEIEQRKPIIEISKGNVLDENNKLVKLSVFETNNPLAAYRIKVDSEGSSEILIGKDGSIQIRANVIKIDSNKIDLTGTPKISVKNMNFMKEGE